MNKSQLNELNVPKLRFKGFEGEWSKKKLTEVCNFFSGITYSKESENKHGEFIVLRANNIYESKLNFDNLLKINLNKKPSEKFFIKDRDILICSNSGSKNLLGKSCIIKNKFYNFLVGGFMLVARDYQPIIPYFFKSKMWFAEININTSGTINSIKRSILNRIFLFLPLLCEQEKIASFFSLLDKQIKLYETKLQLNELMKKYYLSNLFIDSQSFNVPKLRFKEFEGEWVLKKIYDILNYEQPTNYLVTNEKYLDDNNLLPVLTAGKTFILGYTNDFNNSYNKGNVIIIDDFTLDIRYINFAFKIKSSAIKLLTSKFDNLYFIFLILKIYKIKPIGHNRHYISVIQNLNINIPSIREQEKIAHFFSLIDFKIEQTQDLISKFKQIKKYYLAKMFI